MTSSSDPPSFAVLLDWLEGRLPAAEALAVAQRLQSAGEPTQADLAWLRSFQAARQAVRLAAPPPQVRAELRRRFAEHMRAQAQASAPPGLVSRLVAALTFDSRARWAGAGLRSAGGSAAERQLIYATPVAEVEVALNLHATSAYGDEATGRTGGLDITGQVFALEDPAPTYAVQLLGQETEAALTTTSDLGEFSFTAIPVGEYSLVLSASDFEVILPTLLLET
jgi:hypothetical protein